MFTVMTRREAAEAGHKRYYTGRLCNRGHDCQRFTSTGGCLKCASVYVKEYNKRLTEKAAHRSTGTFSYPLHPDDHAAALAYCQALDMQRGNTPKNVVVAPPPEPFDAQAARDRVFGKMADKKMTSHALNPTPTQSRALHPDMEAQLRAFGVIK